MHWNSLSEFLAMGNHGLYVWGSVVVMALLMVAEPMLVLQGRKRLVARLKRQYRAEQPVTRSGSQRTTGMTSTSPTATCRSSD
ncbi:Heme exporter protein CcmD [Candidatus Accumulibacter aalborgensis]|uniref:Heme exporter protein D n=1 Tax=Candidatus Accumulibacter aalborgensis TaxID=1860102 RepID=A0A1A8XLR4_9PROT|nr:heme exporter protein CcmD [Candidatus Accumulibacter aalborgensis]SBT05352.1 Heme exporter protein CcmD [Candidatus Accumulibacter aalborgensis]